MYRPQFAFSTPPGCRDEEFTYFFDGGNTPMLHADVSGKTIFNVPLILEQDAPFYWRGVNVTAATSTSGPNGTVGGITGYPPPEQITVKFQDAYLNDLSDGLVQATQYCYSTGNVPVLDPEIYCPPGGVILFFLQAPVLADPTLISVALYGVKRFKDCRK